MCAARPLYSLILGGIARELLLFFCEGGLLVGCVLFGPLKICGSFGWGVVGLWGCVNLLISLQELGIFAVEENAVVL